MSRPGSRTYSEQEKAAALEALALSGMNLNHTAQIIGIPSSTLREWSNGANLTEATYVQFAQKRTALTVARCQEIQQRVIDKLLSPETIEKMRASELFIALGIITDKLRVMQGKPTNITESRRVELGDKFQGFVREAMQMFNLDEPSAKEWVLNNVPETRDWIM